MNINNSLPSGFSNNVYESNSQTAATYMPVTYNNNVNVISDQNNDATIPPDHASFNHYQHNVQHIQQSGISNNNATSPSTTSDHNQYHNYQQHMSNVDTNNNVTFSSSNNSNNHDAFTHHNNQQSNNVFSPPQSYNNQNQPSNPSQSNILPLLNSFGININSPQATIIIIPTTNSDILQRVLARFQQ
ncbi:unnamed protein product [Rhizophagus irregularis]|uniref:Uncharacterized protein n=1 Tax=Rhizophagus irregularis TaxID=588596 RepID=A0A2N1MLU8_9GLOM|nr:hypothetical protein RhiirC2_814344 [Rhizophagus irregularis]CAB4391338.1 unnamed protein product [Rhizophagus irregularis]CAB5378441.1 unnamed protein product [Rhizophagus irregularis]